MALVSRWDPQGPTLLVAGDSMIHTVGLKNLPQDLEFPAELSQRVWYDKSQQRLVFDGFMSKSTFDRLEALHPDLEYRRALEAMFRIAVLEDAHGPPRQTLILVAAGLMLVLMASAVGLFQWYAN